MRKHTHKVDKKKNGNLKLREVEDEGPKCLHCSAGNVSGRLHQTACPGWGSARGTAETLN